MKLKLVILLPLAFGITPNALGQSLSDRPATLPTYGRMDADVLIQVILGTWKFDEDFRAGAVIEHTLYPSSIDSMDSPPEVKTWPYVMPRLNVRRGNLKLAEIAEDLATQDLEIYSNPDFPVIHLIQKGLAQNPAWPINDTFAAGTYGIVDVTQCISILEQHGLDPNYPALSRMGSYVLNRSGEIRNVLKKTNFPQVEFDLRKTESVRDILTVINLSWKSMDPRPVYVRVARAPISNTDSDTDFTQRAAWTLLIRFGSRLPEEKIYREMELREHGMTED